MASIVSVRHHLSRNILLGIVVFLATLTYTTEIAFAESAFKIKGKETSVAELAKEEQAAFFEIETQRYRLIERLAKERYLKQFWARKAKETGKSEEAAKSEYFAKNAKLTEKEITDTIERFKDHPQLKKLSKSQREKQIRDYLRDSKRREVEDGIISAAISKKDLQITYPEPEEPIYKLSVDKKIDPIRYGPLATDIKSQCKGNCPITIIEYSEFQCPFCVKVLPAVKQVMTEYRGKVQWIVRDFPLSFHDRARPAAIAARCAMRQGKYWQMYNILFENQRKLSDSDLASYAKKIGLDTKKWQACVKKPADILAEIDKNFESGRGVGVTGTPAFFVNGRKLSGALPFAEFKRVIDKELKKK